MTELSKPELAKNMTLDHVKENDDSAQKTISPTNRNEKFVGLCRICYSSGVQITLTEDPYNSICEKCKK